MIFVIYSFSFEYEIAENSYGNEEYDNNNNHKY